MKKCKKIALLVIVFLLSTTLNVFADGASANITLTPSPATAKAGDTVTVTLSAECATKIEGIDSTLSWDNTKLQLTNQDALATNGYISMSGVDESTGEFKLSVLYNGSGDAPTQTDFATLNFKLLEAVTANEKLAITLSKIEVGDSDDAWIAVGDKTIELTVEGDVPPSDGGEDETNPPAGEDETNPPSGEGDEPPEGEDGTNPPADEGDEPTEGEDGTNPPEGNGGDEPTDGE